MFQCTDPGFSLSISSTKPKGKKARDAKKSAKASSEHPTTVCQITLKAGGHITASKVGWLIDHLQSTNSVSVFCLLLNNIGVSFY